MASPDPVMAGSYDYRLVALSILIAVLASYAALDLAGRVTAARGTTRMLWLGGGATAMGIGIWSMHYVGMLAFRLPVPVQYDWPTALVSLLAAVFASDVAIVIAFVALLLTFHFRDSTTSGGWQKALSAVVMGAAIPVMHYRKNTDAVADWFCYWGFWGSGNDDWPKT